VTEKYPEHAKLEAVAPQSQAIGEFLEWLMSTYSCELGRPEGRNAGFRPVGVSTQQLLAEFFEIDLDKLEAEKRAMLDALRARAG